jgi:hypothetical protein
MIYSRPTLSHTCVQVYRAACTELRLPYLTVGAALRNSWHES